MITEMSLTQQNFYVYLHRSVQQDSFLKQVGICYDWKLTEFDWFENWSW